MNTTKLDNTSQLTGLEWTGERYIPEVKGDLALEHIHRYALAKEIACGKIVLDIASGEGYGSKLLSEVAEQVFGVDLSSEAVTHANFKYGCANLEFLIGSCSEIPLPDRSIDLVVSFETIEHHNQHEEMMKEIKRVLRPSGVVLISSPEKYEYSIYPNIINPYHIKELFRDEFEKLISCYFSTTVFYGQRIIYGSGIFLENGLSPVSSYQRENLEHGSTAGIHKPQYIIALASDGSLPIVSSSIFEENISETEFAKKLETTIRELSLQIDNRDRQLENILESTSWKLTKPLRFLHNKIIYRFYTFLRRVS
jgi:SAM-dependent methyltransferase